MKKRIKFFIFIITADNAGYIYTGVQAQYKLGLLNLTPSFTPGIFFKFCKECQ